MTGHLKKSSILRLTVIVVALLFAETSYATIGNASTASFSQKQITSFIKTTTTELELSKNWKSSFASTAIACTGFSSPVWIQPTADSINFQAVSYGPEYVAFRTSAPARVRTLMDSTYNQMYAGKPRVVIARATQGASTSNTTTRNSTCQ